MQIVFAADFVTCRRARATRRTLKNSGERHHRDAGSKKRDSRVAQGGRMTLLACLTMKNIYFYGF
jgi:hypothetical protein